MQRENTDITGAGKGKQKKINITDQRRNTTKKYAKERQRKRGGHAEACSSAYIWQNYLC